VAEHSDVRRSPRKIVAFTAAAIILTRTSECPATITVQ